LLLIFTCRELTGNKCTVVTQPKSNVYANFTTGAYSILLLIFTCRELTGNKCTVVTQPKSRASASSATPAYSIFAYIKLRFSISSLISAMVIPDSITAEFK